MTYIIYRRNATYSNEDMERLWSDLCEGLAEEPDVARGTMMRRPALLAADKTFVFWARLHGPGIGVRIQSVDPASLGLVDWRPLQPFRGKAPMRGWIVVGPADHDRWVAVARAALQARREEVAHA